MRGFFTYLVAFFTLFLSNVALAEDGVELNLISEVEGLNTARPFWLAVHVDMDEAHHVPWGEEGELRPRLSISSPNGFDAGQTLWPVPARLAGVDAYSGSFTLLQEFKPHKGASASLSLVTARLSMTVCQATACKDVELQSSLAMNLGSGTPVEGAADLFEVARSQTAIVSSWPIKVGLDKGRYKIKVLMDAALMGDIHDFRFLPLSDGMNHGHWMGKGYFEGGYDLATDMGGWLEGIAIVEWKDGTSESLLVRGWAKAPPKIKVEERGMQDLWPAFLAALLGGIILNLMPCVFPILTIKIFSLVKSASVSPLRMRLDGLAYTAGILLSFIGLGGLLLLLRAMGHDAAWGFQLQSPFFVMAVMVVLLLVGLNFLGVYNLPSRWSGLGQGLSEKSGLKGSFFTGVLAVLVASPCTVPFMAPAVAYAIGASAVEAVVVFAGLGLGLALPYLVISFVPAVSHAIPKPGTWMVRLREFLSFPIFATAIWLMWVLGRQVEFPHLKGLVVAFLIVLSLGLVLWVKKHFGGLKSVASGVIVAGLLYLVAPLLLADGAKLHDDVESLAYSEETLMAERRLGKPVFLNVTASWCVTCIVQERLVFSTDEFHSFMIENQVVYMVADWTNPNPEISRLLDGHGRKGIPFYLYYPKGGVKDPVALPEVFTTPQVLEIMKDNL